LPKQSPDLILQALINVKDILAELLHGVSASSLVRPRQTTYFAKFFSDAAETSGVQACSTVGKNDCFSTKCDLICS
jgi:hypothetical protein